MNGIKKYDREILGGITTFLTMSYIVIVNPSILSTEGTGMPFSGVLTATVLLSFFMTLFMGLYAKLPFAVAPGMGINAFFTFSMVLGMKVPWQTALGCVFWSGVIFVITSITPVRQKIVEAIPTNLRSASSVGIGIFLTFIGLKNTGLVVADPVTFVKIGHIHFETTLALAGLAIMSYFFMRKNAFAFLIGILTVTIAAILAGKIKIPENFISAPDFSSVFLKLDIFDALKISLLPAMLSIFFTDLFDSVSSFIGVSQATGLVDKNGEPKNLKQGLIVDAFATLSGGLFGTSPGTAYIESASGIEVGGRTGLTAIVTALCFLPCLFIAPLAAMVPAYATAPVLIIVGSLMFKTTKALRVDRFEESVPAFITIALIPLTFSITQGILWGFISHTVLYVFAGRAREIKPMLWGISFLSVGLVVLEQFY